MKQKDANAILAVLDREGWWNGRDQDGELSGGRGICLKMAIDRAVKPVTTVCRDIETAIRDLFPERVNWDRNLRLPRSFNDHPATTEDDVRTVIKAATDHPVSALG